MSLRMWWIRLGCWTFCIALTTTVGCGSEKPQICVDVSECASLGDDYTCRDNQCLLKTEEEKKKELCPDSCTKDDECAKCTDGLTACVRGACRKPEPKAEKFGKCGNNGKQCGENANCVVLQQGASHGYCLPTCVPSQNKCENDIGVCRELKNGQGACIPQGQVDKGGSCTYDPDAELLNPTKACKSGYVCLNGKCDTPPEKALYEKCDQLSTCVKETQCVVLQSGAGHGYCLSSCDPAQASCDGGKGICESTNTSLGVCFPQGTQTVGGACGVTVDAEKLDASKICRPELRCVDDKCIKPTEVGTDGICNEKAICKNQEVCIRFTTGTADGVCLPLVKECDETTNVCATGRICLPRQDGTGLCVKDCSAGKPCPTGTSCEQIPAGQTVEACIPPTQ